MSKLESLSSSSGDAAHPLICAHLLGHSMLTLSSLPNQETINPLTRVEGGRLGHLCQVIVIRKESPLESTV